MNSHKHHSWYALRVRTSLLAVLLSTVFGSLSAVNSFGVIYSYDLLNRLTNVNYGNGSVISYTYDPAGNRLTYSGVVAIDAFAPNVVISSPTAGATFSTTAPLVNLGGTSSDNVGVTLVGWSNDRGGMGTATGTTNWTVTGLPLQPGTNVISVTAYDAAGNGGVATLAVNYVAPGPATNMLFTDAFSDNVIDPNKWTASGNTVTEASQTMQVLTTVTDSGGVLTSVPAPISPHGDITITRRAFLHYANEYFAARMNVRFGELRWAGVHYGKYYDPSTYYGWEIRDGIYLGRNGVGYDMSLISTACDTNLAGPFSPIWDTWFTEKLVYSPDTGNLQYYTNDQKVADYFIGVMPPTNTPTIQFQFQAWGWWTGHQQLFDDFLVTQTAVAAPQVELTGMSISSNGVFRCVLNGPVGSTYVIQASSNLVDWSSISLTTIPVAGLAIITDQVMSGQPRRFYRAVQGPTGGPAGMVLIPAGSFTMGDANDGNADGNAPTHTVNVSAFYMDTNLVSYTLWTDVYQWALTHGYTFDNAGSGKGPNHPAQSMTWYDTVKWCNARSEKEGRVPAYYTDAGQVNVCRSGQTNVQNGWVKWSSGYRLPTEAEWEKAARGGASGHRFPWGDTISWGQANYYAYPLSAGGYAYDVNGTSGYNPAGMVGGDPYTTAVGTFAANGYGLYDMSGNVWQWCWDWYDGAYYGSSPGTDPRGPALGSGRVNRGGGWIYYADYCRAAYRYSYYPGNRYYYIGFRSVLPSGQ